MSQVDVHPQELADGVFELRYDCVRDQYTRPLLRSSEPLADFVSIAGKSGGVYRKVEPNWRAFLTSDGPGALLYTINHPGAIVQNAEVRMNGLATFRQGEVGATIICGKKTAEIPLANEPFLAEKQGEKKWAANREPLVETMRVHEVGEADQTIVTIQFEDKTPNAGLDHDLDDAQVFRTPLDQPNSENLVIRIEFARDPVIKVTDAEREAGKFELNYDSTQDQYTRPSDLQAQPDPILDYATLASRRGGTYRKVEPDWRAFLTSDGPGILQYIIAHAGARVKSAEALLTGVFRNPLAEPRPDNLVIRIEFETSEPPAVEENIQPPMNENLTEKPKKPLFESDKNEDPVIVVTDSEHAVGHFELQYDSVRDQYRRPFDPQIVQPIEKYETLAAQRGGVFRKVEPEWRAFLASKMAGALRYTILHSGARVKSAEARMNGVATFRQGAIGAQLKSGDKTDTIPLENAPFLAEQQGDRVWGLNREPVVEKMRVDDVGDADKTTLVIFFNDKTENEQLDHDLDDAQVFRTPLDKPEPENLVIHIEFVMPQQMPENLEKLEKPTPEVESTAEDFGKLLKEAGSGQQTADEDALKKILIKISHMTIMERYTIVTIIRNKFGLDPANTLRDRFGSSYERKIVYINFDKTGREAQNQSIEEKPAPEVNAVADALGAELAKGSGVDQNVLKQLLTQLSLFSPINRYRIVQLVRVKYGIELADALKKQLIGFDQLINLLLISQLERISSMAQLTSASDYKLVSSLRATPDELNSARCFLLKYDCARDQYMRPFNFTYGEVRVFRTPLDKPEPENLVIHIEFVMPQQMPENLEKLEKPTPEVESTAEDFGKLLKEAESGQQTADEDALKKILIKISHMTIMERYTIVTIIRNKFGLDPANTLRDRFGSSYERKIVYINFDKTGREAQNQSIEEKAAPEVNAVADALGAELAKGSGVDQNVLKQLLTQLSLFSPINRYRIVQLVRVKYGIELADALKKQLIGFDQLINLLLISQLERISSVYEEQQITKQMAQLTSASDYKLVSSLRATPDELNSARCFLLKYDCARDQYMRPFNFTGQRVYNGYPSLLHSSRDVQRMMERGEGDEYAYIASDGDAGELIWRIEHPGAHVSRVQVLISGMATLDDDAKIGVDLRCGEEESLRRPDAIPYNAQRIDIMEMDNVGPANFTEVIVNFIREPGHNKTKRQPSQLFRAVFGDAATADDFVIRIEYTTPKGDTADKFNAKKEELAQELNQKLQAGKAGDSGQIVQIITIISTLTLAQRRELLTLIKSKFGVDLENELKNALPKESGTDLTEQLFKSPEEIDEVPILKSPAEIDEVPIQPAQNLEEKPPTTEKNALASEFSGDALEAMNAIVQYARNPAQYFADRFNVSIKDQNERDLIRLVVTRAESGDLPVISAEFKRIYGLPLTALIISDSKAATKQILANLAKAYGGGNAQ
uniref:Baseplate assembly protein n=1 Tax=Globodera pallida TaxID=36090 RepID=A0A183CA63_GLOPA